MAVPARRDLAIPPDASAAARCKSMAKLRLTMPPEAGTVTDLVVVPITQRRQRVAETEISYLPIGGASYDEVQDTVAPREESHNGVRLMSALKIGNVVRVENGRIQVLITVKDLNL